jgi:hypothetical protein
MSLVSQLGLAFVRLSQEISNRGMPRGGTTGQLLSKTANTDFAAGWISPGSPVGKGAEVSHTGTVALGNGVGTQVGFDSQNLNDDSTVFTLNTSGVLLAKGGLFLITWHADLSGSAAGNRSAFIQCAGVTRGEFILYGGAGFESRLSSSRIIRLAAGTQISLMVAIDGGGNLLGSAPKDTSMTVAYLGS